MADADRYNMSGETVNAALDRIGERAGSNILPYKSHNQVVTRLELLSLLNDLTSIRKLHAQQQTALNFYRLRVEALAEQQRNMRDPERKMVCDIIANGKTYQSSADADTYTATGDLPPEPLHAEIDSIVGRIDRIAARRKRNADLALFIFACCATTVALAYIFIGPPR